MARFTQISATLTNNCVKRPILHNYPSFCSAIVQLPGVLHNYLPPPPGTIFLHHRPSFLSTADRLYPPPPLLSLHFGRICGKPGPEDFLLRDDAARKMDKTRIILDASAARERCSAVFPQMRPGIFPQMRPVSKRYCEFGLICQALRWVVPVIKEKSVTKFQSIT